MSEAKKLSQDNAFVSDLVLTQHACPSRDNQNDQRQQKRQPTAVDPAEGKLRKITTQQQPGPVLPGIPLPAMQPRGLPWQTPDEVLAGHGHPADALGFSNLTALLALDEQIRSNQN